MGSNRRKISTLALGVLCTTGTFAANIYVSPNGDNARSGLSQDQAVLTISKASQLAKAGDTVIVAPGVYKENVVSRASGRSDARIIFKSEKKGAAQIVGTGINASFLNYGSYVDILDFDVSGSGRLGIQNDGSFVSIRGNHVHDLKVSGGCTGAGGAGIVNANYSASDNEIIGNVVHDVGLPGSCNGVQGIYHSNLRGKVQNNIVYRVSAFGIHLWHAADRVLVSNNTVFANGSKTMGGGIVFGTGDAPGGIVLDNSQIVSNIVYDNPAASILTYCYSGENCIGDNNLVSNNLVFKNGSDVIRLKKGTAFSTINKDPEFVNYLADGKGDYHLKSTSPAINQGIAGFATATDLDGVARVGAPDIGAYEFKPVVVLIPKAQISASSLDFPLTTVGLKSAAKVLTLSSSGNAPLVLQSLEVSGDFNLGNGSCIAGRSYAPGESCSIEVLFAPSAAGARAGSLKVLTNSNPALPVIALSGSAELARPVIQLSASSLSFGNVILGSASATQSITISNVGNAPLIFSQAFTLAGDYAYGQTGTCSLNVSYAPKASCTVSIVFKPKALGVRNGSLSIVSNASNPLLTVSFSGTGIVEQKPVLSPSLKSLDFGNVKVGSKSVVKIITITNTGTAPLIISRAFVISGPFAFGGSGTCSVNVSYAPGKSCTVSLVFAPKVRGLQAGSISYYSNAAPVTTSLSGTGIR